jgi:hypothetical protein
MIGGFKDCATAEPTTGKKMGANSPGTRMTASSGRVPPLIASCVDPHQRYTIYWRLDDYRFR